MTPDNDTVIQQMVEAIVDVSDPEQVIPFGSRGRGDFTDVMLRAAERDVVTLRDMSAGVPEPIDRAAALTPVEALLREIRDRLGAAG